MNKLITEKIKDIELKFKTQTGVFSKNRIDAGTRLLIDNVEVKSKSLIADLGCGAGIIGICFAKLFPSSHIHLLDVNLRNVNLAKENIELNNLVNIECFLSDIFSAVESRTYNLILSNPPQHLGNLLLDQAAAEINKHLKENGVVYWVMQKHLKPYVERLFEKHFKNSKIIKRDKGYILIKGEKSNG